MGRRWVPFVVVVVGALLGLAVAGLPDRGKDAPLAVETTEPPTTTQTTAPETTPTTSPPPPTRSPASLRVVAVNASGVAGAAARLSSRLEADGYEVGEPASRRVQDGSALLHLPGLDAEARALAGRLGLEPSALQATESPPGEADLAVIIGGDLAPRL